MIFLTKKLWFPPVAEAMPDGLLAVGGDLLPERLLLAYKNGIFPWFEKDDPILWWSPNPRFVLFPRELKVSKSTKKLFKQKLFTVTCNTCFNEVITRCALVKRNDQEATWITNEMIQCIILK